MGLFKIGNLRLCLFMIVTGVLMISFVVAPLSIVRAQNPLLTRKWKSSLRYSGAWEGGFVIGDIMPNNPGEEVVYAGKGGVQALDGRDGHELWYYNDNQVGGYAKPNLYDIDGDGDLEVLVPLYYQPGVLVLYGDGRLWWRRTFGSGGSIMSSPVACDVDGDGKMEIFIAMQDVEIGPTTPDRFDGQIRKLSYDGKILAQSFSWRSCGGGVSIADTDHDGEFEVYMGDRNVYMGDGAYGKGVVSFWASNLTYRWFYPEMLCSSQCPVIADANKDGIDDVIVCNQRGGLVVLNATNGSPIKRQSRIPLPGPTPNQGLPGHQQLTVYDIDYDGNLEVLTMDGAHPSSVWPADEVVIFDLYQWKVDARIKVGLPDNPDTGQFAPTLADVDGDGKMEIIAIKDYGLQIWQRKEPYEYDQYGLQVYENIYTDDGSGTGPGGSWRGIIYGRYAIVQDIDADGLLEVVVLTTSRSMFAWDTNVPKPAQRIRSEVIWYSEYRRGAAEYIPPPSKAKGTAAGAAAKVGASSALLSYSPEETTRTLNPATDPWYNQNWKYRRSITINHNLVSAGLTDFPVLVDVTDESFASHAQSDGDDFLFTDSLGNKLNHEIERYESGTGHLVAWVKVPSLSASEDTLLYLYYGNPTAENQQNPTAVWDDDYMMVQHFSETSGTHYDSTANDNDGTPSGVTQNAVGKVDGADDFDGSNDYISVPHSSTLTGFTSAFTASFWIKMDSVTGRRTILNKYNTANKQRAWYIDYYASRGLELFASADGTNYQYWYASFSPAVGTWYHIAVVWQSGQTAKFHVNGVMVTTTYSSGTVASIYNNELEPLYIGMSYTGRYFDGVIDEVRISNPARSAEWIKTCYNNQMNPAAFISVGPEETAGPTPPTVVSHIPGVDATGVPVTSTIQVTFNKPMDKASTEGAFSINPPVSGSFSWTSDDKVMTFTPSPALDYETEYTVTITTDAMDKEGQNMESPCTWSFTTEEEPQAAPWYDTNWQYRKKITISSSQVAGALTNFPVLISVTDGDLRDKARSDGFDILFTDYSGVNKLDHEIERYESGTGHLVAWVKVPSLSASEDTVLYMYYGNSEAANQQNPTAVWDSSYKMVQHFEETSGTHYDSTSNGNNGTPQGGVIQGATGKIDGADTFDGSDDYVTVPHSPTLAGFTEALTVEAWIKMDNTARRQGILNKYVTSPPQRGWLVEYYSNQIRFFASPDGTNYQYWSANLNPAVNTWYHIAIVWQANQVPKFYINGQLVSTSGTATISRIFNNEGAPLDIGRCTYDATRNFDGVIDEVRISNPARSAEWIKTCYNNQMNPAAFISVGPEETAGPTPPTVVSHIPGVDATGVPVTSTIQVTFNKPMDKASTEGAFSINPPVSGSFSWTSDDKVMTFTPSSNLAYDKLYTVTISTAAKSKEGQNMLSDYVWSFRTEVQTFNVHLESRQNTGDSVNLGTITFDGTSYTLPKDVSKAAGSYSAQYIAASGYIFDSWERTGGITVSSTTTNPTTVTVSGSGTLRAVYKLAPSIQLVSSGGTNTTSEDLICYGGSGIYNWYVDGVSLTNLLFTFDDPTVVKDYSPYGNNGINHGATWTANGILGGAYYFDGDFDYIYVPDKPSAPGYINPGYFNGTSFPGYLGGDGSWPEITVELWVYLSSDQNNVRFVAKLPSYEIGLAADTPDNRLFAGVFTQDGTDFSEMGYRGYSSVTYGTPLSTKTWYHVAFTYNSAGLTLYLNGVQVGFTSSPIGNIHCSSGEPIRIGWFDYFHGMIDELRIYPRALSPQQIMQRYLEVKNGIVDRSVIVSQETLGNEVWKCNVFQDGSSQFSNTLTIVNNAPTVDNVRIGPHQELTLSNSSSLVALYDYHDIDQFRPNSNINEQPESGTEIQWYKNGVLQSAYNNQKTLPAGAAKPGEQWMFRVRPKDGVDFGSWVESPTVTIVQNRAPAISGNPTLTQTGGNLVCSVTSTDPDGQPVTNIYNWYVNNAPLTNLQLTFDTDNMLTTKDYSYGANGAIYGATWTSQGVVGGAYIFDGNDYIKVPDSSNIGPQGTSGWSEISIEFWIKVTENQRGSRIIARKLPWARSGSYIIGFQTSTSYPFNTLFFGVSVPGEQAYAPTYVEISNSSTTVLTLGIWYHVVCTYKSSTSTLTIYINGTQRATTTITGGGAIQPDTWRTNDEPLFIGYDGAGREGSSSYFRGMLDEIRIYRRALTPQQVLQRFNESNNGQTSSSTIVSQETSSGQTWYCQVTPNDKYQDGTPKNSNNVNT